MKRKKRATAGTITSNLAYLRRLVARIFRRRAERSEMAAALELVQTLIGRHTGPVHKSGPYKGHSITDSVAWVKDLAEDVQVAVRERNRGRAYDENMAIASEMGLILVAWYAHVHRAKSYDPNRPLHARRAAAAQRTRFMAQLAAVLADDSLMGEVWGRQQRWNFPFGRGAKGGRFV